MKSIEIENYFMKMGETEERKKGMPPMETSPYITSGRMIVEQSKR